MWVWWPVTIKHRMSIVPFFPSFSFENTVKNKFILKTELFIYLFIIIIFFFWLCWRQTQFSHLSSLGSSDSEAKQGGLGSIALHLELRKSGGVSFYRLTHFALHRIQLHRTDNAILLERKQFRYSINNFTNTTQNIKSWGWDTITKTQASRFCQNFGRMQSLSFATFTLWQGETSTGYLYRISTRKHLLKRFNLWCHCYLFSFAGNLPEGTENKSVVNVCSLHVRCDKSGQSGPGTMILVKGQTQRVISGKSPESILVCHLGFRVLFSTKNLQVSKFKSAWKLTRDIFARNESSAIFHDDRTKQRARREKSSHMRVSDRIEFEKRKSTTIHAKNTPRHVWHPKLAARVKNQNGNNRQGRWGEVCSNVEATESQIWLDLEPSKKQSQGHRAVTTQQTATFSTKQNSAQVFTDRKFCL